MKFKSKNIAIKTGDVQVCLIHIDDAKYYDIWPGDRIAIHYNGKCVVAMIDTTRKETIIRPGIVGLFKDVVNVLDTNEHDEVTITFQQKPLSIAAIKKNSMEKN